MQKPVFTVFCLFSDGLTCFGGVFAGKVNDRVCCISDTVFWWFGVRQVFLPPMGRMRLRFWMTRLCCRCSGRCRINGRNRIGRLKMMPRVWLTGIFCWRIRKCWNIVCATRSTAIRRIWSLRWRICMLSCRIMTRFCTAGRGLCWRNWQEGRRRRWRGIGNCTGKMRQTSGFCWIWRRRSLTISG